MGIGISVEGLTKSFGSQRIWEDVAMDIPEGETGCGVRGRRPTSGASPPDAWR
jgi:ABC-type transporter Mla maintaining outer membrane lipid asymmetry ATPase subunit MlaF